MFNYCLILAAGNGIRLMPLTEYLPKAMLVINDRPLIFHSLHQVRDEIENLIVTVGLMGDQIASYVLKEGATAILETRNRGNAYWLFHTLLKTLDEPVLVLPCDNIVTIDLNWIHNQYLKLSSPPCLVIPVNEVEGISGDYILGKNHIVSHLSRENKSGSKKPIYCSGMQVINPAKINQITKNASDFYQVWNSLLIQNELYYSDIYPYPWYSVNTAQQLYNYQDSQRVSGKIKSL